MPFYDRKTRWSSWNLLEAAAVYIPIKEPDGSLFACRRTARLCVRTHGVFAFPGNESVRRRLVKKEAAFLCLKFRSIPSRPCWRIWMTPKIPEPAGYDGDPAGSRPGSSVFEGTSPAEKLRCCSAPAPKDAAADMFPELTPARSRSFDRRPDRYRAEGRGGTSWPWTMRPTLWRMLYQCGQAHSEPGRPRHPPHDQRIAPVPEDSAR